jgi:hypothetical protein
VEASTIITGNYDYLQKQVTWNSAGEQSLPASFYLDSAPAYFAGYTWPWVDPVGAVKEHTLPAKARYDAQQRETV